MDFLGAFCGKTGRNGVCVRRVADISFSFCVTVYTNTLFNMDLKQLFLIETMCDSPEQMKEMEQKININEVILESIRNEIRKEDYWANKLVCIEVKAFIRN